MNEKNNEKIYEGVEKIGEEILDKPGPKLNIKRTLLIGLGFMTTMLAWGMYNFYIPRILAGHIIEEEVFRWGYFTGDARLFWANFVMTLDNIFAILLQPYFGEISDRLRSKYGRRTPFLLIGIPISAITLLLMPFVVRLSPFWIIFASLMILIILFNIAMSFYRAPVVALMPDLTPSEHRSMANVLINAMGGVGVAIGFMIAPFAGGLSIVEENIVGYAPSFEEQNFIMLDFVVFGLTALFIVIVLIIFLILVKEVPTGDKFWEVGETRIEFDPETLEIIPESEIEEQRNLKKKMKVTNEVKGIFKIKDKSTAYTLLAIFLWSAADDAFNFNLSLWGSEYAYIPDSILGSFAIVMGIFVLILGIPGAYFAKNKGRIWTLRAGFILFVIGYTGIIIFQELARTGMEELGIAGVAISVGIKAGGGGFLAIVAITTVWQMAPKDKVGTYTGVYYVFKQGGSVLGPQIMGVLLASFTSSLGTTGVWVILNPFCLILSILGFLCMLKVNRGEVGDEYNKEELAIFDEVHATD